LEETTTEEITKIIEKLPNKKSCGIDNLPNLTFKILKNDISSTLSTLINESYKKGIFPDILKISKIIPLHKSGDKSKTENYRPIALLPNLSKIFEETLRTRIEKFLEKHNLIIEEQFGFRKNHSTCDAIRNLTDYIYDKLDNNKKVLTIFIDLKKAFDTICHTTLLNKLYKIGIRGNFLDVLRNYLENRQQKTYINNETSDKLQVKYGLPQGSRLSPLLFTIYVNDITKFSLSKQTKLTQFADDNALTIWSENLETLYKTANEEIFKLHLWYQQNILTINIPKCKYIEFKQKKSVMQYQLKLENDSIEKVENYKYLGTIIDNKLNWKEHINHIKTKINQKLPMLHYIKNKTNTAAKHLIYNAFIKPHITYTSAIYGSCNQAHIKKLQKIQNKAINTMYNNNKYSKNIYKTNNILQVKNIIFIEKMKHIYKYIKYPEKMPNNTKNIYDEINKNIDKRLKQKYNLYTKFYNKEIGKKHSYNDTTQWNKLNIQTKNSTSTYTLIKALKSTFKHS
jgi:hypothetical protein